MTIEFTKETKHELMKPYRTPHFILKCIRTSMGYAQKEIAYFIDISEATYASLEHGIRRINNDRLNKCLTLAKISKEEYEYILEKFIPQGRFYVENIDNWYFRYLVDHINRRYEVIEHDIISRRMRVYLQAT